MSRDQVILKAAIDLFYERGFDGVGVDDLGERAGITGPAIYRHFKGKDEVLATLFDQAVDALLIRIGGDHETPREELEHLVHAHAGFVLEQHKLASIWAREDRSLAEPFAARHHRREKQYIALWTDCLSRTFPKAKSSQVSTATWAAVGLLNSSGTWPASARKLPDPAAVLGTLALGAIDALLDPGAPAPKSTARSGRARRTA